jgi:hypothetical protein
MMTKIHQMDIAGCFFSIFMSIFLMCLTKINGEAKKKYMGLGHLEGVLSFHINFSFHSKECHIKTLIELSYTNELFLYLFFYNL